MAAAGDVTLVESPENERYCCGRSRRKRLLLVEVEKELETEVIPMDCECGGGILALVKRFVH